MPCPGRREAIGIPQGLAVLALAMVPVALLWWVWIRMLD